MKKNFWNSKVREISPYVPGEQPVEGVIKLNTNENPYPPSPEINKLLSGFDTDTLKKYPDPDASGFREALAGYYGISPSQIFAGNGSDEVLALAFQAFFDSNIPVCFPDITYSFYPVYAEMFSVAYDLIPVRKDFSIEIKDYEGHKGGVIIANPNAPTGIYLETEKIRNLLEQNRERLVIIDEAYVDFGGESCIPLLKEYDNLLVIQTLSKSRSLAGIRFGYAAGSEHLIEGLERVRDCINSYTTDCLSQKIAKCAIEDGRWFEDTRARIISSRKYLTEKLDLLGFYTLPSMSNFVFTSHSKIAAKKIYDDLRERNILVRHFKKNKIDNFLRITIGTEEQVGELVKALTEIVRQEDEK